MNDPDNGGDASAWGQVQCGCCGEHLFGSQTVVTAHMSACKAAKNSVPEYDSDDWDDGLSPTQNLAAQIHTEIDKHWSGASG